MRASHFISISLLVILSCNEGQVKEYSDTSTKGEIKIAVDENFKPIIDSQLEAFSFYNKDARITPIYTSEGEAFRALINDSVRLVVATRQLNENEKKYFESISLVPKVTRIAFDAIALIMHPTNPDSTLTYEQITGIFNGSIKSWQQINPGSTSGDINIVFDHKESGTARYIRDKLLGGKDFPPNCFAVNSNPEVITYCSSNRNAIGLIGVNWISDGDDPASLGFKQMITVAAITPPDTSDAAVRSYKPYQAYLAQKDYPFTRDVYIISREARSGLGSGFASFVAGDKGQRIILKSGIMPAIKPVRIVGFRTNE